MVRMRALGMIGLVVLATGCSGTNRRLALGTPARNPGATGTAGSPWPGDPSLPRDGSGGGVPPLAYGGAPSRGPAAPAGPERPTVGLRRPDPMGHRGDPALAASSRRPRGAASGPPATLPLALNVAVHPEGLASTSEPASDLQAGEAPRPGEHLAAREASSSAEASSPDSLRAEPRDADARRVQAELAAESPGASEPAPMPAPAEAGSAPGEPREPVSGPIPEAAEADAEGPTLAPAGGGVPSLEAIAEAHAPRAGADVEAPAPTSEARSPEAIAADPVLAGRPRLTRMPTPPRPADLTADLPGAEFPSSYGRPTPMPHAAEAAPAEGTPRRWRLWRPGLLRRWRGDAAAADPASVRGEPRQLAQGG